MCKELIVINRVDLGSRVTGYELYSTDTKEIVGKTEKQIKDFIKSGNQIKGFKFDASDDLIIDDNFVKNLIIKTGIATLTPLNEDSIVNLMYTVIGKEGTDYEVISSRFARVTMPESKVKTLYELGAVNGISIDSKGKIHLVQAKPSEPVKEDETISEVITATA